MGFAVNLIGISEKDPLNVWLVTTKNGKILTWNRKNLNRMGEAEQELTKIYNLEYYLTDSF